MVSVPSAVDRRSFLRFVAVSMFVGNVSGCSDKPTPTPVAPFFTDADRRALGAFADHVFPPDAAPGATALGVVEYIERTLTAFEETSPGLWASGPYSNRQPFPDATGAPTSKFSDNAFATFLPFDRVAEAGLRLWLYGSAGVPGGGPNDAVLGPIVGLRDLIRDELRNAMTESKVPLETLDDAAIAIVYDATPVPFKQAFVGLVCEGLFAAPEYGGNKEGGGWAIAHFDGDSLPLGYSYFDEAKGKTVERVNKPVSMKDPSPDPDPLTPDVIALLDSLVALAQGKKFP